MSDFIRQMRIQNNIIHCEKFKLTKTSWYYGSLLHRRSIQLYNNIAVLKLCETKLLNSREKNQAIEMKKTF